MFSGSKFTITENTSCLNTGSHVQSVLIQQVPSIQAVVVAQDENIAHVQDQNIAIVEGIEDGCM